MRNSLKICVALLLGVMVFPAYALNILVTNDDGFFEQVDDGNGGEMNGPNMAPGLAALKTAFEAAGHTVTVVAPFGPQSGMGGAMSTSFGATIAVVEQEPGGWTVDSSPSDCIRAALGGIVDAESIDLVVSGINSGQNLGMTGTQASGTINAALAALHAGLPAIAISAERFASESITFAQMPAAADFVTRMIDRLNTYPFGGDIIPVGTMLNVNWPVYYEDGRTEPIAARVVNLATRSSIEFVWSGTPATTGTMQVGIDLTVFPPQDPNPVPDNDLDNLRDDYVTISVLNGDMTVKNASQYESALMTYILWGLEPVEGP